MAEDNVEMIRRGIAAFNRRDFHAALAELPDDITWQPFLSRTETPLLRGKDEIRAAWESQIEALDLHAEPEEFIEAGDRVVVPMRMVGQGSGSEVSLVTSVVWVWRFAADGLSVSVELYDDRDTALAATG